MRDDSIPSPPPQSFTWRSYAAQEEVVTYQILPPTSPHTLRMRIQTILDGFFNNPSEPEVCFNLRLWREQFKHTGYFFHRFQYKPVSVARLLIVIFIIYLF